MIWNSIHLVIKVLLLLGLILDAEKIIPCIETNKSVYFIEISDHVS